MSVKIQVSSTVTIDRTKMIRDALGDLEEYEVKIGYPKEYADREVMASDALRRGGVHLTNPQIAYINERGDPGMNIPARPTLIPGVVTAMPQIIKLLGKAIRVTLVHGSPRDALIEMGRTGRNGVRRYMLFSQVRALKPITIIYRQRAGITLTTPLIETGRMRNALSYMIDRNGQRLFLSGKLRETLPITTKSLMRHIGRNIVP